MPKFENRFVHFTWDESLKDKKCFVADSITKLKSDFVADSRETIIGCSDDEDFPFNAKTGYYRFAYYDPNFDVKKSYELGEVIQYRAKDTGRWCDWDDSLGKCTFADGVEYRIKPEGSKLKWTDLSIGDVIERIVGTARKAMVTDIYVGDKSKMHIYAGCEWFSDEALKIWRKVNA